MNHQAVKGVIVAAGYGSRFMPATKTIPKEMLPLMDRPAIDFVVREFLEAGIQDILLISSRRKKAMEDYFDREVELQHVFTKDGKPAMLDAIAPPQANVFVVRQQEMRGTGHALLQAKAFVGDHPFVVAYPDDLFLGASVSEQLVKAYREHGTSLLTVEDLGAVDVSRYGVVDPAGEGNPCPVKRLVEKPARGSEPSKLVSYGRYLFTADLFPLLEAGWAAHQSEGEFYHIDALNQLAAQGKMMALTIDNSRIDTGAPLGYLEAFCRVAATHPAYGPDARALLKQLAEEL